MESLRDIDGIRILVVDDEPNHAHATAEILETVGYDVTVATSGDNGMKTLEAGKFDIVITDLAMHPVSGFDILRAARQKNPPGEVVLMSGHGSVDQAVDAMRLGAANYLTKPLDVQMVRQEVRSLVRQIRGGSKDEPASSAENVAKVDSGGRNDEFPEFVGSSRKLLQVFDTIRKVAPTPATVLISGANGTGKELVAKAIHRLSPRAGHPFVALNCAAIAENILESELFGHVRGAFTGATSSREGQIEFADKGTLFLDEIGEMSLGLQVKLLRVIQEREVMPVGANEPRRVDVRIVTATNKDLFAEVRQGNFREDLYYRLKVIHLELPELKQRREDIPELVSHFLADANAANGTAIKNLDSTALQQLVNFDWPGNVRQLKNAVESMSVLASSDVITSADIPDEIRGSSTPGNALAPLEVFEGLSLSGIEEHMIEHYLARFEGNRAKVASALGISERTLYRKLKEYGISS